MAIYRIADRIPDIAPTAYVHESATVIGSVVLGDRVSVWPQAVVRGDNETITIGAGSNVQDGAILHADEGIPLTLGENVSIAHQVMLHGCTIGDGTLIGIQAVVLNNVVIGRGCLVGAGSVVTEGKVFPDNVMILGSPARVVRELTPEHVARVKEAASNYVEKGIRYRAHAVRIDEPTAG
jgi:carbonic anhydrase/acetyltransferase-like protein (isoleucine patch superfamily)